MSHDYHAEYTNISLRLQRLGLTSDRLERIGAFIVAYGLFKTTLERALWTLTEIDVAGGRPFTERMQSEDQFARLGVGNPKLPPECNAVLKVAAQAASHLSDYRNSLVHGYLMAFEDGGTPSYMKNPA